jgi:hypothetical protein
VTQQFEHPWQHPCHVAELDSKLLSFMPWLLKPKPTVMSGKFNESFDLAARTAAG